MKTRTFTTFAALAAASLAGVSAYAGTPAPGKPVRETLQESAITGDIGFDVTSNYVTKGIVQQNQGLILQPYANLHFRIFQGGQGDGVGDMISSITADIGIWNSFHSHHQLSNASVGVPGAFTSAGNWYEFDFLAGLTFNMNKLAISPYFKVYESPASVFQTTYATGLQLAYDDSDLLGDFALHPYVFVELNLEGTTGNNFAGAPLVPLIGGGSGAFHGRGQYYEVGITPAHSWGDLTVSLPLKGGFGTGGFYLGNRGFGFFSVGIDASYALNFVPESLGKWTVHSGFTYVRLGGNTALNPALPPNFGGTGAAGGGNNAYLGTTGGVPTGTGVADKNQLVFTGGLKVAF